MTKPVCRCKSRAGCQKQRYTSRTQAFNNAIRTGRATSGNTYPCPTARGVWHITKGTR